MGRLIMGIADVRRAVDKGLAGKASCSACTLAYEKGETPGQRLIVTINHGNTTAEVSRLVPHGTNIVDQAQQIGIEYAAQIEGA